MAINYPSSADSFPVPSLPESTTLSAAGSGTRDHTEHHADMGLAIVALETNAAKKGHDHSGDGSVDHGNKLLQAYTHQSPDTDTGVTAIHHTIGTGAWQAAAGNHVHHYSEILDRPYIICTTSTRPTNPAIGMIIYETDTNTMRVWAVFPTNPDATGVIFSDNFHRTSSVDLGASWEIHYLLATLHGIFCTPFGISAYWLEALTTSNWARARCIDSDSGHTDSDDQEITVTHGSRGFDVVTVHGDDSACNDFFFRHSDDGLHYCRIAIFYDWAELYYTVNGVDNEILLGTLLGIPVWEEGVIWTLRIIDWEFHLYRNGIFVGSVVDADHLHSRGSGFRGWGFGCHVIGHSGGQHKPPEIIECVIQDVTSYIPTARWGLLPVASVPILVAESTARQQVAVNHEYVVFFNSVILDWIHLSFFQSSMTDMIISEPGVYHVHASICWDPSFTFCDHAMIAIKVNGQDISRKNWEFIRGFTFSPGFSQTNELNFWYRFNTGDKIQVIAKHNGSQPCWLWYSPSDPDRQVCHVELAFHTP